MDGNTCCMTVQELQGEQESLVLILFYCLSAFRRPLKARSSASNCASATSVTANYHAACRGRSPSEFIAKLCIVVEEADESLMWLEMIEEAMIYKGEDLVRLKQESRELLYIFSASRKSAKHNLETRLNQPHRHSINKSTDQQIISINARVVKLVEQDLKSCG